MSGRARRKRRKREIRAVQVEHDWRRLAALELKLRARACPMQAWPSRIPTVAGALLTDVLLTQLQEVHA